MNIRTTTTGLVGMGRGDLLARLEQAEQELATATRERDAYLANLTETQARCTELIQEARRLRRWVYRSGALLSDFPVEGLTQEIPETEIQGQTTRDVYGARYFVCESISESAARAIAGAFGFGLEVRS